MRIILTIDVELWSWRKNFELDVERAVKRLVQFAEKEKLPLTFFISLSDKGYGNRFYLNKILHLVKNIKNKKIDFGIHTHCKNLPLAFKTEKDDLRDYNKEQIISILKWYKNNLEKITKKKMIVHRAGSYSIPQLKILRECFKKTGLKIDSSDINIEYSKILRKRNFIEIPPATSKKLAMQKRVFSPEQLSLKEIKEFYEEAKKHTDILVINFHSFSIYGELGKKARMWYKSPPFLQKILRPLMNIIKKMKGTKKENIGEVRESNNFLGLEETIDFLKEEKCRFISFKELK